eukprot:5733594-Prorocentrum_lima.AAC.1
MLRESAQSPSTKYNVPKAVANSASIPGARGRGCKTECLLRGWHQCPPAKWPGGGWPRGGTYL